MFRFNPVTLTTPFNPSHQVGSFNGIRLFFSSHPPKAAVPRSRPIISVIGDLNNDGYDDIQAVGPNEKEPFIVYGHSAGLPPKNARGSSVDFPVYTPIDFDRPAPLMPNNQPLFEKYDSTDRFFNLIPDINGDGWKEIVVRNGSLPPERQNYVLLGKQEGFRINEVFRDPGELGGQKGFYYSDDIFEPLFYRDGIFPDSGGDVNGDGINDILFNGLVLFGTKTAFPNVVTRDVIDGKNGFTLSADGKPFIGRIKYVGDLNGDGRDDLSVPGTIIFYSSNLPTTIDVNTFANGLVTDLQPKPFYVIRPLKDINGDGIDDFAYVNVDPWSSASGRTYLFYGSKKTFPSQLSTTDANFFFDAGVYDASDFNGDGYVDLLLARSAPPGAKFNGGSTTYISFGGLNGWSKLEDIGGASGSNSHGINIGDFNGDGLDDIYLDNKIIFGGRLIRELKDEEVDGKNGIIIGSGFSTAGDVNGDGRVDLKTNGYVVFGTDRINNKETGVSKSGGAYNHFSFPDYNFTSDDRLAFTASRDQSDWVYGGWNDDTLVGLSGQMDQFAGGPGKDWFVLNNEYGLQIGKGFAVVWDFDKGEDKVVVHGTANDYFFVEDTNAWLDNSNAKFLKHRSSDTSATVNTILARRCNCEFGAVMIGAFSDVKLDVSDLVFVPNTRVV
jgi:hypothetical protein